MARKVIPMLTRIEIEGKVRERVAGAFDKAEEFVEGLRPVLHGAVNDLRVPVVHFVTTTVDSALEIRERGENFVATVQRDSKNTVKTIQRDAKNAVKTVQRDAKKVSTTLQRDAKKVATNVTRNAEAIREQAEGWIKKYTRA